MSKIFISIFISCISLYAVNWLDYDEASLLQEKSAKIIMIDVVRSGCHYCTDMELEVFQDAKMTKYLKERFILVKINLDEDTIPSYIDPVFTPSFYFINKDKEVINQINGSWNIQDFKDLTKDIK